MTDQQIAKAQKEFEELMVNAGDHTFRLDLDLPFAIGLIATIQLAARHPAALFHKTVKDAVEFARGLQGMLEKKVSGSSAFLELGWHDCFDRQASIPGSVTDETAC